MNSEDMVFMEVTWIWLGHQSITHRIRCVVYLPTFGCFLWYNVGNNIPHIGSYGLGISNPKTFAMAKPSIFETQLSYSPL